MNRKKWKGNLFTIEIGALSKINKKEEENFEQEKLEGDLSFTLSIFSPIVNKDKYTGWQTSHPPLYVLLEIKKLENVENAPLTPPRKARNAGADSTQYND